MRINVERIDKELEARGWSRYRLARELGVNPNTIYSVLKAGSFRTVEKISAVLDVPEMDLVED